MVVHRRTKEKILMLTGLMWLYFFVADSPLSQNVSLNNKTFC